MPGQKTIAIETLNLLRASEPLPNNSHLKAASIIAFPLGPIEVEQVTPRFFASFAIESLLRSICYREEKWLIDARHSHAMRMTLDWVEAES